MKVVVAGRVSVLAAFTVALCGCDVADCVPLDVVPVVVDCAAAPVATASVMTAATMTPRFNIRTSASQN